MDRFGDIVNVPDLNPIYLAILRQQTPAQKMAAIHQLRRTAWTMKAAWIRRCEPQLPEDEVQERVRQLFLRAVA